MIWDHIGIYGMMRLYQCIPMRNELRIDRDNEQPTYVSANLVTIDSHNGLPPGRLPLPFNETHLNVYSTKFPPICSGLDFIVYS